MVISRKSSWVRNIRNILSDMQIQRVLEWIQEEECRKSRKYEFCRFVGCSSASSLQTNKAEFPYCTYFHKLSDTKSI